MKYSITEINNDTEESILRGRIFDSDTNTLLPARVVIKRTDGEFLTVIYRKCPGFWCDGKFEIPVPSGNISIEVIHGFEYVPAILEHFVKPGQILQIDFFLKRNVNLREMGWYCGENHFHIVHGEKKCPADFELASLISRAEGLDYINVTYFWDSTEKMYSSDYLSEVCKQFSEIDFCMHWNIEYKKPGGHICSLNEATYNPELIEADMPNFELAHRIHQNGGIVIYAHPNRWWKEYGNGSGFVSNIAYELPFDTLSGPVYDVIEVMSDIADNPLDQGLWYLLLNLGYRIPAIASSDVALDRPDTLIPGTFRTYSYIEGGFSISKLTEAIRRGRNFVTSGPLIFFSIDSHIPGDVLCPDSKRFSAKIKAFARAGNSEYLSSIQLIRNGEIVENIFLKDKCKQNFEIEFDISEQEESWYIAKCYGTDSKQVAFTNPIYFRYPGSTGTLPVESVIHCNVVDDITSLPIDCDIKVVNNGKEFRRFHFRKTPIKFSVPPTSTIFISADGYESVSWNIFRDYFPLNSYVKSLSSYPGEYYNGIGDYHTYEKLREIMRDIKVEFRLRRSL